MAARRRLRLPPGARWPPPTGCRCRDRASSSRPAPTLIVVVEGLNDHENLGALFRNAAAFGVGAVLLDPTTADPLYRRSVRVSLGHVLHVPFARVDRRGPSGWPTSVTAAIEIVALTPAPDAEPIDRLAGRRPDRLALLLGAEGPGLSDAAHAAADRRVRIPMARRRRLAQRRDGGGDRLPPPVRSARPTRRRRPIRPPIAGARLGKRRLELLDQQAAGGRRPRAVGSCPPSRTRRRPMTG